MKKKTYYAFSIENPLIHSNCIIPLISEANYSILRRYISQYYKDLCIYECTHFSDCKYSYIKRISNINSVLYSICNNINDKTFTLNELIECFLQDKETPKSFIQYRLLSKDELKKFWRSIDSRYLPLDKIILSKNIYSSGNNWTLLEGDSFKLLKKIRESSVDMIFADPPYFLSNGGITCQSGKQASVDKADWDKIDSLEAKHKFNRTWIRLCKRVMKPGASIWISGTMHNIYSIGMALQQEGFTILNNITWKKTNPPPNLACRCFTHSTETILWACKTEDRPIHIFNYDAMRKENNGKQMKDVWEGPLTPPSEKKLGKHPTQKPLYLLDRIIESSTKEGDIVLDPFCGSSTTGISAMTHNRRYIGIDLSTKYLELSKKRITYSLF